MRSFIYNVPLFLPVLSLAALLALGLMAPAARALRTTRAVAFVGLMAFGGIIAATLTPGTRAILRGAPSDGSCDLSRIGLIPFAELTRISESSLNVLLFIPLGIAIGLLPWSRRSATILVTALFLPFVIEIGQALLPALGRGCQSADVADNLTGLVIGLVAGRLAARAFVAA